VTSGAAGRDLKQTSRSPEWPSEARPHARTVSAWFKSRKTRGARLPTLAIAPRSLRDRSVPPGPLLRGTNVTSGAATEGFEPGRSQPGKRAIASDPARVANRMTVSSADGPEGVETDGSGP